VDQYIGHRVLLSRSPMRRSIFLVLLLAACAEGPHVGVEITNAPYPRECIPGSATKPC
jgi:hypothetical protein